MVELCPLFPERFASGRRRHVYAVGLYADVRISGIRSWNDQCASPHVPNGNWWSAVNGWRSADGARTLYTASGLHLVGHDGGGLLPIPPAKGNVAATERWG